MLEKNTYLKGIKYLNAYYTNFNFNINDDLKLEVWYNIFKGTDNETYTELIKQYCVKNVFPPKSPTDIIQFKQQQMIKTRMTPEAAWELTLGTLRETGYDFRRTYKMLNDRVLKQTLKQMENQFYGIHTKDIPYARNNYINIYERELKKTVEEETTIEMLAIE